MNILIRKWEGEAPRREKGGEDEGGGEIIMW